MPSQKLRPVQKSAPGLFTKLPFVIKIFVLPFLEGLLKTDFTVKHFLSVDSL